MNWKDGPKATLSPIRKGEVGTGVAWAVRISDGPIILQVLEFVNI
jgi:hypothetical protein